MESLRTWPYLTAPGLRGSRHRLIWTQAEPEHRPWNRFPNLLSAEIGCRTIVWCFCTCEPTALRTPTATADTALSWDAHGSPQGASAALAFWSASISLYNEKLDSDSPRKQQRDEVSWTHSRGVPIRTLSPLPDLVPMMHMPRNIFSVLSLVAAILKIISCLPSSTYPQPRSEYSISLTSNRACPPITPSLLKTVSSQQLQSTQHSATALSQHLHPILFFPAKGMPTTAKHIAVGEALLVKKAGSSWEATTWQLPQTHGISFSQAANSWCLSSSASGDHPCWNVVEDTHPYPARGCSQASAAVEGGFALEYLTAKRGSGMYLLFLCELQGRSSSAEVQWRRLGHRGLS